MIAFFAVALAVALATDPQFEPVGKTQFNVVAHEFGCPIGETPEGYFVDLEYTSSRNEFRVTHYGGNDDRRYDFSNKIVSIAETKRSDGGIVIHLRPAKPFAVQFDWVVEGSGKSSGKLFISRSGLALECMRMPDVPQLPKDSGK